MLFALVLLAAPSVAAAARPARAAAPRGPASPRDLIENVVGAYGGRAALDRIRSYRMLGRIMAVRQEKEGPMMRLFERPGRLRVELRYPDAAEVRIVNGARGWRSLGDEVPDEVTGPLLESMILQAARANVPWILIEHAAEARRAEPYELRGRRLEGVEIPIAANLTVRVYADPATWRVELSQGWLDHHGQKTQFETIYSDFRAVDGVLFAHREENYASGAHTGYTAIERVLLNPKTGAADFGPPIEAKKGTKS
jgi:hypothetical protein